MAWEYFTSTNFVEVTEKAKNMGWKNKEVQVRVDFQGEVAHYYIEPFERDCECPNIIDYRKVFGYE